MAILSEFYTGLSDANLEQDAQLDSGKVMVQRIIHEDTATYVSATTHFELVNDTIAADDNYNSAGVNFELIDNGAYDIIFHQEIKRLPNEVTFLSEAYKRRKSA